MVRWRWSRIASKHLPVAGKTARPAPPRPARLAAPPRPTPPHLPRPALIRQVERFVFRPGLSDRARYYAVVYLNQMVLSHREGQGEAGRAGAAA